MTRLAKVYQGKIVVNKWFKNYGDSLLVYQVLSVEGHRVSRVALEKIHPLDGHRTALTGSSRKTGTEYHYFSSGSFKKKTSSFNI